MTPTSSSEGNARPLRVAIIGYGLAGAVFHAPLVAATGGMTVAGIVTSNPERQQRAQRDYPSAIILPSAEDLWHEPSRFDLVVVASPNRTHVPLGIAAMEAGLPVVIDKPMAATAADAERLIATSKATGRLLTAFQNRRWDGDFLTVRQLLATEPELNGIDAEVQAEATAASEAAEKAPWPEAAAATLHVYSEAKESGKNSPDLSGARREISFVAATVEALDFEMARNPRIFVLGEGIGARGGNFGTTAGMFAKYGAERLCDTPICERGFVGLGCGGVFRGGSWAGRSRPILTSAAARVDRSNERQWRK